MVKKGVLVVLIILIVILLPFVSASVLINEIMYDAPGSDNNREFLELFNSDYESVNLSGFIIGDLKGNDTLVLVQGSYVLESGKFALVTEDGFNFSLFPNLTIFSVGATIGNDLNNDQDTVFLYYPNFSVVDFVSYTSSLGATGNNFTLERFIWFLNSTGNFKESSSLGGTPGKRNSITPLDNDVAIFSSNITFYPFSITPQSNVNASVLVFNRGLVLENVSFSAFFNSSLLKQENLTIPFQSSLQVNLSFFIFEGNFSFFVYVNSSKDNNSSNNFAEVFIAAIQMNVTNSTSQGVNTSSSGTTSTNTSDTIEKLIYEVIDIPSEIFVDREFNVKVKIVNNKTKTEEVEVWSYVYRGPKCYSCYGNLSRSSNSREVDLSASSSVTLELKNKILKAENGKYKLKVNFLESDLKTPKGFIFDIDIKNAIDVINTSTNTEKDDFNLTFKTTKKTEAEESTQITGLTTFNKDNKNLNISTRDSVYFSKTERIKDVTFLIFGMAILMSIYLIWKKRI